MPDELLPPVVAAGPDGAAEDNQVHLIYRIEGKPNEIPIFELAHTLQALGTVIQEANRVISTSRSEIAVSVESFKRGSFAMDVVMFMQRHPEMLFFLSQQAALDQIKTALEYIGLIKKGKEGIDTVKGIIEFLKGEKPTGIEKQPDGTVNYISKTGDQINVSGTVSNLYMNPVITNNYFYAFGGNGMDRNGVEGVRTFLKHDEDQTNEFISSGEVLTALKTYSEPSPSAPRVETAENTTVEFLNPKEGTYGSAEGVTFLPAGRKRGGFKATITDAAFLARFHSGQIRFFQNDLLKVTLLTESTLKDGKLNKKFTILKVLDYQQAPIQDVTG
jgi:hypothetical protein